MNMIAFYKELIAQGFCLSIEPGDGLGVSPKDKITPELRDAIRSRKPELLDFLQKHPQPDPTADLILAAQRCHSAKLFPQILALHVAEGSRIADVTAGRRLFWKHVDLTKYQVSFTDLQEGVDCRCLPFADSSYDAIVLDPPFRSRKSVSTESHAADLEARYSSVPNDKLKWHATVVELYREGGREAHRVLRQGGILIAKCQVEISSHRLCPTHLEITLAYQVFGFELEDQFVQVRPDRPPVSRMKRQRHARNNYSLYLVFKKKEPMPLPSDAPLIVPAMVTPAPARITVPAIPRQVLAKAVTSPIRPTYQLSGPDTKVYVGDCRQVLAQFPKRSVDLIFADPPFNIGEDYGAWNDNLPRGEFLDFTYEWLDACLRVLGDRGTFWVNIPDDTAAEIVLHLKQRGLVLIRWCIWHYRFGQCTKENWISSHTNVLHFARDRRERVWNPDDVLVDSDRATVYSDARTEKTKTPGKRVPLDVWGSENDGDFWGRVPGNSKERRAGHENQLPERYLERVILATSNAGQLVLDPFLGSGTTCTVARALQRPSIGIEIDPNYAASAFERIKSGPVRVKPLPPPPTLLGAAPPVVPDIVIDALTPEQIAPAEPVQEPAATTPLEFENAPTAPAVPAVLADPPPQQELVPDAKLVIGVGGPSAPPCAFLLCDGTTGPGRVSLQDVIAAVKLSPRVALDCETWLPTVQLPPPLPAKATATQRDAYKALVKGRQLSPRRNRVRLVQLATETGEIFVIDCQANGTSLRVKVSSMSCGFAGKQAFSGKANPRVNP
jgi:site-specific DNA-methyltransferase (adenine-specific)